MSVDSVHSSSSLDSPTSPRHPITPETAFGCPRDFLNNRLVYVVISPRARGLSVGVNMNPDAECNFDCPYCEVNHAVPKRESALDLDLMAAELQDTLEYVQAGRLHASPTYSALPEELLQLRHVTLSGDGEPTLCPKFVEAVQTVVHVRALGVASFFKVVLITNATHLSDPEVQKGLRALTHHDEVWAKLDAGTQSYFERVNRGGIPLERVLKNILATARERAVVIQSLFPMLDGKEPGEEEIRQYALRLKELREQGANIPLVQIYSATRPMAHPNCGHLPLKALSQIARTVRSVSGLRAEVF